MSLKFLLTTIIPFTLTACIHSPMKVNYDSQPPLKKEGVKVGTIDPDITKALGIVGNRTLMGGFGKEGNLVLFGTTGSKFKLSDKKPSGNPIRSVQIDVYKNSPLCYHIDPGDGEPYWYPEDCPHPHLP